MERSTFPLLQAVMAFLAAAGLAGAPVPAVAQVPQSDSVILEARPSDLKVSQIEVRPRYLHAGDTVRVSMVLQNTGPAAARSQRPAPSTVYAVGQSYDDLGFGPPPAGSFSVVATISGPETGTEWPWRWGIGGDLAFNESRRVSYPIRFERPGTYRIYVGTAVGDRIQPATGAYFTSVEVLPRGAALPANRNIVPTPPPVRITVNGREVNADERARFYQPPTPFSNVNMLVPIRFVMEEMGANVRWDRTSRTAEVYGGAPPRTMTLRAGSRTQLVNGEPVQTPIPLPIRDGRLMVPLWFVTRQLGGNFNWDARTQTLAITVPERTAAGG